MHKKNPTQLINSLQLQYTVLYYFAQLINYSNQIRLTSCANNTLGQVGKQGRNECNCTFLHKRVSWHLHLFVVSGGTSQKHKRIELAKMKNREKQVAKRFFFFFKFLNIILSDPLKFFPIIMSFNKF